MRWITVAALCVFGALSWILLARSEAVMTSMSGDGVLLDLAIAMMRPAATVPYLGASALMWLVMMAAMMTPALLPVLVLFSRLDRGRAGRVHGPLFAAGYLGVWLAFGVLASLVQWALHRAALLHGHALLAGPKLAGGLLLLAGVYQLTPLKSACLAHCQSPVAFLLGDWRDGAAGAWRMGVHHGALCLGCCWALMLLMFVGGVMSVAAMAVLSAFVLAERLLPAGWWATTLPGALLLGWGAWTLLTAG